MAKIKGTTGVGATLAPASDTAKYPATSEQWHKGGFKSFATIAERDNMLSTYRIDGMHCYVKQTDEYYRWSDEKVDWVRASLGSSSTTGLENHDLSVYALKSELPDISTLASKMELENQNTDLTAKLDAALVELKADLANKLEHANLAEYETTQSADAKLELKADKHELEPIKEKLTELEDSIPTDTVSNSSFEMLEQNIEQKADKTELAALATKAELDEKIAAAQLGGGNADTSNLATKAELETKLGKAEFENEKANFATKDELANAGGSVSISAEPDNNLELKDDGLYSNGVSKDQLDEFDTQSYKNEIDAEVERRVNEAIEQMRAKTDEAIAKVDGAIALINKTIDDFKATYPTLDDLDEFDANAFKDEIIAELRG